ncbi:1,4-alpha-glucan branching protein GlgB [[Clostridium] polysaccharolyticum]|uniref:1,4-alpha-glucan branching enzyme GlgB n=1 Tax=[Clostridium] polysaccharolyticum TaxID=29364 RepID=A0A1I0D874_9FIRM|nr:1,4-alpha-glucan branching protein GlgB [[Clostridium] polysaccharolyticum]SET28456.1 1,4-alpha-glucan branching enzyme [[Clostridium] polysaccharolyticum]
MQEVLRNWINEVQYKELIEGVNNCPHKLLGMHQIEGGKGIIVYRPQAWSVEVIHEESGFREELQRIDDNGVFGRYFDKLEFDTYTLAVRYGEDDVVYTNDPYNFEPVIGEMDRYLFGEGNHYEIYKKLGAHPMIIDGVSGTYFAVWAPNARAVSVVGNFNMWDSRLHPMRILGVSGIYELFIPGVGEDAVYKYFIRTRDGKELFKSDPYGNYAEVRPDNASKVTDLENYNWRDKQWEERKAKLKRRDRMDSPITIYEVHPGSWKKHQDGTEDGFYTYRELAEELGDYLLEMKYTHVELMGIAEHPFDGSWGYQVVGYYAPTSRYGTPQDFMYFVDYMHQRGIGVILDWVPAHFPKDAHGLGRFDGEPLYEHPDKRRGEHPHWGTYIFNYGKKEVENFLIGNAIFWIKEFHIDGLRVDAVASMLYLDYGKSDGEWLPNEKGGNENTEAIQFMQHLNRVIEERHPSALIIAEESTAWAGVTAPVGMDGLGFLFKWNMGWMNDFLEYMKLDPYFRKFNQNMLTFSFAYAGSENFIEVLSHDEVVHGKGSMINKMPGTIEEKFANLRAAYGLMYAHPGKKLLFMGQEIAQSREWSEKRELDWFELQNEKNRKLQAYVKKLNEVYQMYPAFYSNDYHENGFEWVDGSDCENSVISFIRKGKNTQDQILVVCSFTPIIREKYLVGVPALTSYKEIINSDAIEFGGCGKINRNPIKSKKIPCQGKPFSIELTLPPLSVMMFKFSTRKKKKRDQKK